MENQQKSEIVYLGEKIDKLTDAISAQSLLIAQSASDIRQAVQVSMSYSQQGMSDLKNAFQDRLLSNKKLLDKVNTNNPEKELTVPRETLNNKK